jgi:hypothetical protein
LSPAGFGVNGGCWVRWRAGEKAGEQQRSKGHNGPYELFEDILSVIKISDFRAGLIVEFEQRTRNRQ